MAAQQKICFTIPDKTGRVIEKTTSRHLVLLIDFWKLVASCFTKDININGKIKSLNKFQVLRAAKVANGCH